MGPGFESQRDHLQEASASFFMPYTYIIYFARLNKHYVGACTNMEPRLYEHTIGHSKFTSSGVPWVLKYSKDFATLQKAKRWELYIKKMKSRKYIEQLISEG